MRDATLAAIREEVSLECLTRPVWTKRKPTWVVPWHNLEIGRNKPLHTATATDFKNHSQMPDCSRGRKADMDILRQSTKPDSLFFRGSRFGKILQVSQIVVSQDVEGVSFEAKVQKVMQAIRELLASHTTTDLTWFVMLVIW
jgi:hypothetical protein